MKRDQNLNDNADSSADRKLVSDFDNTAGEDQPDTRLVRPLRFLTLQQVANELATTPVTIRALIRSGELPAIQIGGRGQWRVERIRLEEYITAAYTRARTDIGTGGADLEDDAP